MYGYWYSVREHYSFERKEFIQLLWTSLAFAFILSFRKWGSGDTVDVSAGIGNLLIAFVIVIICMYAHVALQKLVGIKLGYKVTYGYWLNGILLSLFLALLTQGIVTFILPGAVTIAHIPKLRLGKFRFGTNLKDIARIALAGPITHVLLVLIIGGLFFITGRNDIFFSAVVVNLLLAVFSILPIPKIDSPSRMDSGTDGLGMFYFSRTLYVLVLATIFIFTALVLISVNTVGYGWLFLIALVIGILLSFFYSISLEQKN